MFVEHGKPARPYPRRDRRLGETVRAEGVDAVRRQAEECALAADLGFGALFEDHRFETAPGERQREREPSDAGARNGDAAAFFRCERSVHHRHYTITT